ncbi:MAG: alpha/beta hydrolase [Bdellovibrionales bacterium]|nr:alpha/beta hydrolase [Bdellovibrionales bacterium]
MQICRVQSLFLLLVFATFSSIANAQCILIFPGTGDNPHSSDRECNESTYNTNTHSNEAAAEANERGYNASVADYDSTGSTEDVKDDVEEAVADAIENDIANGGTGDVTIVGHSQGGIAVLASLDRIEQLAEDYGVNIDVNTAGAPTGGVPFWLKSVMVCGRCFTSLLGEGWLYDICEFKRNLALGSHDFPATNLSVTQYTHPADGWWSEASQEPGPEGAEHIEVEGSTHNSIIGDVVNRLTSGK